MKITLIGAGNVAWHLGPVLLSEGHEIVSVYSRTAAAAETLAQRCQALPVTDTDFRRQPADVFIVAVPDAALETLTPRLLLPPQAAVVHTSGTFSLEKFTALLADETLSTGVWYPLQTFSKSVPVRWEGIPMLIEAPQTPLFEALRQLTDSLRATAVAFTSDERRQVHAAAVIAGNFANHLWGIAAALLQPVQQPLRLLEPLLQETLRKAVLAKNPFQVQTGPAIRADEATLAAHLQLLQAQPEWEKVYQVLSASIQKTAILPKEE